MKDRIPTYAGRIRLTPVENQPNVYDTERADEPIQEGTPLNTQNLLSDETAELLGLSQDATPSDAFKALLETKTVKVATGSYSGAGSTSKTLAFDFTPKVVLVQATMGGTGIFIYGCEYASSILGTEIGLTKVRWAENTLSFGIGALNSDGTALNVFNALNNQYIYMAIG